MTLERRLARLERLAPPAYDHEDMEAYRKKMEKLMECLWSGEKPPEPTTPAEGGKYRQLLKDRLMRLREHHGS